MIINVQKYLLLSYMITQRSKVIGGESCIRILCTCCYGEFQLYVLFWLTQNDKDIENFK